MYKKEFLKIMDIIQEKFNFKKRISVDLLITDNKEVRENNLLYRNVDKETDVLSFPFGDPDFFDHLDFIPLGSIIISHEKIVAQALEFNHSKKREFCYLFTHSLLHLLGYDHKEEDEEKIMNQYTKEIVEKLNIYR
ncbi:rRNA maturation RNase YbeY [Mycoplasmopsis pulmonis]|nr:rRNA maturation RNase YbeY [Mycoplasmopsis pulmonis]MDZ7293332.1 rRNA maturation RNase YbeY [Mycoplasmopsis pulmonis]